MKATILQGVGSKALKAFLRFQNVRIVVRSCTKTTSQMCDNIVKDLANMGKLLDTCVVLIMI